MPPVYQSCAEALHRVRRECPRADGECARALGVYESARDAPCAPTCCELVGTTALRYVCTVDGGDAQCQRVHGLPLHGAPTRVASLTPRGRSA